MEEAGPGGPSALRGTKAQEAAPLLATWACDPKQVREGSVRLDRRACEGPGGPRGVRESWGAGLRSGQSTARASPHCAQFPLPRLGQPGVGHSFPACGLLARLPPSSGPNSCRRPSAPSHPLCILGKPRRRQLTWVVPPARGVSAASPTFLPPRALSATTFRGSTQCVALGWGGAEVSASAAESSGKQTGKGELLAGGLAWKPGDPDSSSAITGQIISLL